MDGLPVCVVSLCSPRPTGEPGRGLALSGRPGYGSAQRKVHGIPPEVPVQFPTQKYKYINKNI